MGARLVAGALNPHWARTLTPNARLVLVAMCLQARDTPTDRTPEATYWGGRDELILALKGDVPDEGTPAHRTVSKQVQRAVAELIRHGAVVRTKEGRRGQRAEYVVQPYSYVQPVLTA